MCGRETNAQRQAKGRAGEEHAPAARRPRRQSGSSRAHVRDPPDLFEFGGAVRAQRVDRQHRAHRQGAQDRAMAASEGRLSDRRNPSLMLMARIAEALGVPLPRLLSD